MTNEEAIEWLKGNRSWTNMVPSDGEGKWLKIVAEADCASVQEAYWIARAHKEGLVPPPTEQQDPLPGADVPGRDACSMPDFPCHARAGAACYSTTCPHWQPVKEG